MGTIKGYLEVFEIFNPTILFVGKFAKYFWRWLDIDMDFWPFERFLVVSWQHRSASKVQQICFPVVNSLQPCCFKLLLTLIDGLNYVEKGCPKKCT